MRQLWYGLIAFFAISISPLPCDAAKPLISFTFDDGYGDPVDTGVVRILEQHNMHGTFYIITDRISAPPPYSALDPLDLRLLALRGHEVAAHTRSHADLTNPNTALNYEIVGSRDDLQLLGIENHTFAYPFGKSNANVVQVVQDAGFVVARGTDTALNTPSINPFNLQADSLKATRSFASIKAWIDSAIEQNAWYIMLIHKVGRPNDLYSISEDTLASVIDYISTTEAEVVTIREGACIYFGKGCTALTQ